MIWQTEDLVVFRKTDSENASDSTITTDRMTLGNDSVKHQTVRTIGDRLRFKVLLRDNFKCRICGASPATDPTVVCMLIMSFHGQKAVKQQLIIFRHYVANVIMEK